MITTKKVERSYTQTVTDKYICDFCHKETKHEDHANHFGNWDKEAAYYGVDSIVIQRSNGNRWPNGDVFIEKSKVDMCPTCWETKFLFWLTQNGVTPRMEETEY